MEILFTSTVSCQGIPANNPMSDSEVEKLWGFVDGKSLDAQFVEYKSSEDLYLVNLRDGDTLINEQFVSVNGM